MKEAIQIFKVSAYGLRIHRRKIFRASLPHVQRELKIGIHSSRYPRHFQNPYHAWLQANILYYISQFNPTTTITAIITADFRLGIAVNPVIVAIAKPEFEDGLKMGVLPGDCLQPRLI